MPVSNWSTTAASNASTLGIDIGEGCDAANVNNGMREIMAQAKTKFDSLDSSVSGLALTTSLSNLGAVANVADKIPYMTGSNGWSTKDLSFLLPIACVLPFARNTAPTGFLECNGAAVSRSTYSALFAIVGTVFGAGDGSTTFNVPDLRGEFVRGWDNGRGVDAARAFGSAQAEQVGPVDIELSSLTQISHDSSAEGDRTISASGTPTSGYAGGTETRPRNIALLYGIKY